MIFGTVLKEKMFGIEMKLLNYTDGSECVLR